MRGRGWLLLVLLVVLAAGGWYWFAGGAGGTGGEAKGPPPPPEVTVAAVRREPAAVSITAVGTVRPVESVQIQAQVEGPITNVAFTEGQVVKPGDLLFEIDPRPYQAALAQAQGTLAQDRANLEAARRDLARAQELAAKSFQSRQALDQQRARTEALEATVRGNEARVAAAQVDLERTRIVAPVGGRVSQAQLTLGNIARPGQATALTTINQIDPIDVQFSIPQNRLPQVRDAMAKGPIPAIALDAEGGRRLAEGELSFIDNTVDPATGTVAMKARFKNPADALWPGQFLTVALEVDRRPQAVVVDAVAVSTGPDGRYVYLVRPDDTVEARPVTLAVLAEGRAVVDQGLQGGERVIVNGQLRVVPGGKVRVREAPPPPEQSGGAPAQAAALPAGGAAR